MRKLLPLFLFAATFCGNARAETFQIDPIHSNVSFRVRHMMVSHVIGRFHKFRGAFQYQEGKPAVWTASATISAESIDTDVAMRDNHLRSPDFLDAAKCPELRFVGSKVTDVDGNKAKLHGDLTIHCVTRPVVLDVEIGGTQTDPTGALRAGATATTRIQRKDFGLLWNKALEAGGVMVGEDVDITLEIEGIAKPDPR